VPAGDGDRRDTARQSAHDADDSPPPSPDAALLGGLPRGELRQRASAGVFIVATRGVAILLLGFGGTVVVARLLSPRDFGIVAIGVTLTTFAALLSDGGLGGALIRRAEPPTAEELRALTALQLTVTAAIALVAAAIASRFGEAGWVVALMVSSMPVVAFQFPGKILLERSLSYRPLAMVEVSQVVAYQATAIGLVVAGLGVWGLASATVVRAVVAAMLMVRVSPVGLVWPRFSWTHVRPLIGFGLRFQAVTATWLLREQLLNVALAVVATVSTLGLWRLAGRFLELPFLLLQSLFRISFPSMSQLVAAKEDVAPLIERAAGMTAVGAGTLLTGLAGSAPGLVPGLFGEQWSDAAGVLPGACLGILIAGSIAVATQGYLYAVGDPSAVLRSQIFHAAALFAVALPLVPVLGVAAVGLGVLVASVVEAIALGLATLRWTRVRLLRPLLGPVALGSLAAAAGWLVADLAGRSLVSGIAGGACSVLLFQVSLLVFRRQLLLDTFRFGIRAMRAATSRGAAADPA
jgi:O-antigen/teichoic acid export membrane protein